MIGSVVKCVFYNGSRWENHYHHLDISKMYVAREFMNFSSQLFCLGCSLFYTFVQDFIIHLSQRKLYDWRQQQHNLLEMVCTYELPQEFQTNRTEDWSWSTTILKLMQINAHTSSPNCSLNSQNLSKNVQIRTLPSPLSDSNKQSYPIIQRQLRNKVLGDQRVRLGKSPLRAKNRKARPDCYIPLHSGSARNALNKPPVAAAAGRAGVKAVAP